MVEPRQGGRWSRIFSRVFKCSKKHKKPVTIECQEVTTLVSEDIHVCIGGVGGVGEDACSPDVREAMEDMLNDVQNILDCFRTEAQPSGATKSCSIPESAFTQVKMSIVEERRVFFEKRFPDKSSVSTSSKNALAKSKSADEAIFENEVSLSTPESDGKSTCFEKTENEEIPQVESTKETIQKDILESSTPQPDKYEEVSSNDESKIEKTTHDALEVHKNEETPKADGEMQKESMPQEIESICNEEPEYPEVEYQNESISMESTTCLTRQRGELCVIDSTITDRVCSDIDSVEKGVSEIEFKGFSSHSSLDNELFNTKGITTTSEESVKNAVENVNVMDEELQNTIVEQIDRYDSSIPDDAVVDASYSFLSETDKSDFDEQTNYPAFVPFAGRGDHNYDRPLDNIVSVFNVFEQRDSPEEVELLCSESEESPITSSATEISPGLKNDLVCHQDPPHFSGENFPNNTSLEADFSWDFGSESKMKVLEEVMNDGWMDKVEECPMGQYSSTEFFKTDFSKQRMSEEAEALAGGFALEADRQHEEDKYKLHYEPGCSSQLDFRGEVTEDVNQFPNPSFGNFYFVFPSEAQVLKKEKIESIQEEQYINQNVWNYNEEFEVARDDVNNIELYKTNEDHVEKPFPDEIAIPGSYVLDNDKCKIYGEFPTIEQADLDSFKQIVKVFEQRDVPVEAEATEICHEEFNFPGIADPSNFMKFSGSFHNFDETLVNLQEEEMNGLNNEAQRIENENIFPREADYSWDFGPQKSRLDYKIQILKDRPEEWKLQESQDPQTIHVSPSIEQLTIEHPSELLQVLEEIRIERESRVEQSTCTGEDTKQTLTVAHESSKNEDFRYGEEYNVEVISEPSQIEDDLEDHFKQDLSEVASQANSINAENIDEIPKQSGEGAETGQKAKRKRNKKRKPQENASKGTEGDESPKVETLQQTPIKQFNAPPKEIHFVQPLPEMHPSPGEKPRLPDHHSASSAGSEPQTKKKRNRKRR